MSIKAMKQEPTLQEQLDDADRRAGAAERELETCRSDLARINRVRDKMKDEWGVDRNVSFDVVWAEALKLKRQATQPAAQRQWVGLTDEDIEQEFGFIDELLRDCVHRTEAKVREKNL